MRGRRSSGRVVRRELPIRHGGRSSAFAGRIQHRPREAVFGQPVLIAPHAPHVVEDRRPEIPEGIRDEIGVRAGVDRRRRQAGRLVGLERQQVELDGAQHGRAVALLEPVEVDVVVPVRRREAHVVDAIAQRDVVAPAPDGLEPQRAHRRPAWHEVRRPTAWCRGATRFGTAGAPAPSPAASSAPGRVGAEARPGSARRALQRLRRPHRRRQAAVVQRRDPVRHGGRSSAFAGRIVGARSRRAEARPGSARRALQRLRRPHRRRQVASCRGATRFGTAGAPAPSPAASSAPGRVVQRRDPVRHGGRSSAFAGRIVGARPRRAEARPGSARRALQRLRRPHRRRQVAWCRGATRFGTAGAPAPSPAASSGPGRVVQRRDPVRHGGRSSAFAGRIVRARPRGAEARPGSARRALQRLRRPHYEVSPNLKGCCAS